MTRFRIALGRLRTAMRREWHYVKRALSHKDPNYRLGLRQEQRVVARLKRHGWYAMRRRMSRPMKIRGRTYGEDVFAFRNGVGAFITCKTSRSRVTTPFQHKKLVARMRALAGMFGGVPVFCGTNSRGRDYFVRLDEEGFCKEWDFK